jgi:aminoglycoside 6-adenylyltransferase
MSSLGRSVSVGQVSRFYEVKSQKGENHDIRNTFNLIMTTGQENPAILMIGSEGSRNDPTVKPDQYQDYDMTYFVSDADFPAFEQFERSHFGELMIQQILPEKNRWCWLMQFMDGNRLDLKIQPISSVPATWQKIL